MEKSIEDNLVSCKQTTEHLELRMRDLTVVHLAGSFRPLTFHEKKRKTLFLAMTKESTNTETQKNRS